MRARFWPIVISVVLAAVVGPRLTAPHDKEAGEPFVYEPPDGFVPSKSAALEDPTRVWVESNPQDSTFVARVSVSHSASVGTVEPADLAQIAQGLPETFATEGVEWSHLRHETRLRADGARVGIVEGDCKKTLSSSDLPGITAELRFRRLQLVFPDDAGTSIITAHFAADQAAKWAPLFEASVGKARGVATRVPPPPPWMTAAWAGAGLVLGWLLSTMLASRPRPAQKPPEPEEPGDDEDEDEAA